MQGRRQTDEALAHTHTQRTRLRGRKSVETAGRLAHTYTQTHTHTRLRGRKSVETAVSLLRALLVSIEDCIISTLICMCVWGNEAKGGMRKMKRES